jgi:hypothetical protein
MGMLDAGVAGRTQQANEYLQKHQLFPPRITMKPESDLGLVVVIPCFDEPEITLTLDSIWSGQRPRASAEVIVLINDAEEGEAQLRARNRETVDEIGLWVDQHKDTRLRFHTVYFERLPKKHAGVGLARKLGMDEAVARLHQAHNPSGIIVCLDADCVCASNYLLAIEEHFEADPATPGCAIHFEHQWANCGVQEAQPPVVFYELFLRYYVRGQRYAQFPNAFQTVGSSMAVTRWAYEKQGGMNRRQGGEDFYFLNKIMNLGNFSEIGTTTVYPSARLSTRVPFGTGRALTDWESGKERYRCVMAPDVFLALRQLFEAISCLYEPETAVQDVFDGLAPSLVEFLRSERWDDKLAEIRANVASRKAFIRRFFQWFDAFRLFRFTRWASEKHYPRVPIEQAVSAILMWQGHSAPAISADQSAVDLLLELRSLDRAGADAPSLQGTMNS